MRRTLPFIAAASVLGVGCTVGPDYEPPTVDAPEEFVSQETLAQLNDGNEAGETLGARWWEGFNDETLIRIVDEGLPQNNRIRAAQSRVREAQVRIRREDANDAPRLEASGGPSLEREVQTIRQVDTTDTFELNGGLGLAVPLDFWGRNEREVEAAVAALAAAEADLQRLVIEVSANIVREYMLLRGNQRQLELLRESIDLQEETLSIVQIREETGLAPELDVRRAEASVQNLYADVPPLQRALQDSRNRLAVLAGQFPGVFEEELTPNAPTPTYGARIPESIPLDVLMSRPDVARAEAALREATARIGVEVADLYPSFDLAASARVGLTAASSVPTVDSLIAGVAGTITQVLLDGGARRAEIEIARAQADAALHDYRETLLFAVEEVEQVLSGLRASQQRQKALEKAVTASAASFEQAEILYQEGLISFLDVVDAQRVLADAEQRLASERTNRATLLADLFRVLAVGGDNAGGQQPDTDRPAP